MRVIRPRRFALTFTLLMLGAVKALAADWAAVIPPALSSVPRLEMQSGEHRGSCSGAVFLLDDGWAYALTAAHCVSHDPGEKFDLTANDRHAVAVDSNTLLDLAIVKFRAHHETAVTLASVAPKAGAEVAVVGFAFGVSEPVVQVGRVAQSYNRETKTIWIDAMTIFGDSGGLVMNEQGQLVAITSRVYSGGLLGQTAHIAAAVTLDAVKDFVDDFSERLKKERKK